MEKNEIKKGQEKETLRKEEAAEHNAKREMLTPVIAGSVLIPLAFQFVQQAKESAETMPFWLWIAPVIFIGAAIWAYFIVWKIYRNSRKKKQE